jgi:hypothetical protein
MTPRAPARAVGGLVLAGVALAGCSRVHVLLGQRAGEDAGMDAGRDSGGHDASHDAAMDGEVPDAPMDVGIADAGDGSLPDAPMDVPGSDSGGRCPLRSGTRVRECICSLDGGGGEKTAAVACRVDECYVYPNQGCIEDEYVLCDEDEIGSNPTHAMHCRDFCLAWGDETWATACDDVLVLTMM